MREECGDFFGREGREDADGREEEIAVMVVRVEAGGFEEDGVGGGFDEGVDGGGEGCVARVQGVGHGRVLQPMIAEAAEGGNRGRAYLSG